MYNQNEKEIEDFICNNQEQFIESIRKTLELDEEIEIIFLGRQVKIGENNIADLIYYYRENEEIILQDKSNFNIPRINYIIVELKYNELKPQDLAQLSRYMSVLGDKLESNEKYYMTDYTIKGILLGNEADEKTQELIINSFNDDIYFMQYKQKYDFNRINYSHNTDYIEQLKLDERIEELYKQE